MASHMSLWVPKVIFWSANYSACVTYTKTIIHRSVGESDGYLPREANPSFAVGKIATTIHLHFGE